MIILASVLVLASLGFSANILKRFLPIQLFQSSPVAMEAPVAADEAGAKIEGSRLGLNYSKGLAAVRISLLLKAANEGDEGAGLVA